MKTTLSPSPDTIKPRNELMIQLLRELESNLAAREEARLNAIDTTAGAGKPPTAAAPKPADASGETWSEKVKTIGGLVAVGLGVLVVGVIAIIALIKDTSTASTIASSASGVVATIVGAYFGVKVGTDQGKTAMENQKAEAAKAQVFAAHLPADQAKDVLQMGKDAAKEALGK
jgi:hypothetical protein